MLKSPLSRRSFLARSGAVAAGITLSGKAMSAEEAKLNFYNWDTYIAEDTLPNFKKQSGIKVKMDIFGDNDELFAKLREGNPGYDVIVPTNDYVARMAKAGMLQPLDHSKIPNFKKNVGKAFQDGDFDPKRKYSMPYMWGTMGLAYRKSKIAKPTSWDVVFGPGSAAYKGKIAWISESNSMIGMVCRYLGHSFNTTDPKILKQATDQLIKYKGNVLTIAKDNGQDLLASGECDLVIEWNGDIAQLANEDPDVGYVIPKEGSYYWQDCMAIAKGAPHPDNAHKFINYILDAEVGKDLAEYIEYATPNEAARALTSESYRTNPFIFPSKEELATLEPNNYLGEEAYQVIENEWTRLLSA